ncbi:carbohydrate-binding domain-containing protein [Gordonibacter massiliensis (ex Traore et al. 2017)]|uniref:Carbohydrate-binding domain-containing protein n=1 Tax=Gordonibacter massiliensis (ex Traore et al. 2017) TaxID=1841863 RepID=A0A842J8N8_9ACTN|nr:carbohydrate-binding domain-containing protein [Gordonibacter massiliensis (ex Traore et al. 2017)]MBC2888163.1 carbohydrate-binding domain-containing protein [Gordonibacter massiliensis (ex Traore et al. 2017)]
MNKNTSFRQETGESVGDNAESPAAFVKGVSVLLAVCLACMVLLQGCTAGGVGDGAENASGSASAQTSDAVSADGFAAVAAAFDASALDLDYSKRDLDASYNDASATHIALNGGTVAVEGDGATADESTVTIAEAGTYVVSGTLDDGQLAVEAPEDAKVQIVLAGATIHNEDGPAVYVKQADKCFVTLADGTVNTLTDGAEYALEEGSDEPYATLFSKDDLTLNGSGTLNVTSSYRHAVCSKDDLVITGGTYVVDAVEDGLRGRDCVKICDGTFDVRAGGDTIKSNKDTDATRGFVSIDGGTFRLEAGDDGIKAQTYLRIAGGDVSVKAADDALHSNLEGLVAGGSLTIDAGDDAFHAETKLVIDDGTVNVTNCYEGYEAEKLYINGAVTRIVASDDALNAAAADLGEGADAASDDNATSGTDAAPSMSDGGSMPALPDGESAPELPDGAMDAGAPPAGDGSSTDAAPQLGTSPTDSDDEFDPSSGGGPRGRGGSGEGPNESELNGGKPDNAFAEGGAGGMGMGDENCLIQINGGYTVLEAGGDGVDSNGNVEVTGGVLLVCGPTSNNDGAFDYDLTATVTGGTVLMVGSTGMAQNFTSGEQPFSFTTASGSAGQSVAVTDDAGNVLVSFTPAKQFGMVLATSPAFTEGGTYSLVIGGTVAGANADGYADTGTVTGGTSTEITASTTASGGFGGLGSGGGPMAAGQGGDVQRGMRGMS